ncbi:MAG: hypothetical protein ABI432_02565 [Flavobacteriales bacterium]
MPIARIYSSARSRDVHVVAGRPYDLGWWYLSLVATDEWFGPVNRYLQHHSDIRVRYEPLFRGTQDGSLFRGHGVVVNTRTGNIAVQHGLPEPRLRNFIVRMTVTNDPGGQSFTLICRVHIHERIERIWMTPPELHIHRRIADLDRTRYYFSLRAQYEDGCVGDISSGPYLVFTSPDGQVDSDGELLIRAADPDDARITIGAHISYAEDTLRCEGTLVVLPPWGIRNPIKAELATTRTPHPIPANQADAEAELQKARNVLLICDGFTKLEEFNGATDTIVKALDSPLLSPFNHLKDSIRFWRAFIPSRQPDVSVGAPLALRSPFPGVTLHWPIPLPMEPPSPIPVGQILDEREVAFLVGLPHSDDAAGDMDGARRDALRARWRAHYGQDPYAHLGSTNDERNAAVERWRSAGNWGFAEEVDSPLGVAHGMQTWRGNLNSQTDLLSYRMSRQRMDDLLGSIVADGTDRSGNPISLPIGRLFVPDAEGHLPPDYDMVCILLPSTTHESNGDGYFFVALNTPFNAQVRHGSRVYDVLPRSIPPELDTDVLLTFVHELCHSLHLGDEHAQFDRAPNHRVSPTFANLVDQPDVLDPSGQLVGENVRWRWHRILCAAVLEDGITVNQGTTPYTITIPVRRGHAEAFRPLHFRAERQGNRLIIHLRGRDTRVPMPAFPPLSVPLILIGVDEDRLVAQPAGGSFNYQGAVAPLQFHERFTAGAIAYVPRAHAETPSMSNPPPYAELLAANVLDFMNTAHLPFTPWPSARDARNTQIPIIDPRLRMRSGFRHMHLPRIVGLYSGGSLHHLGVFHATGFCMMRMTSTDPAWYPKVQKELCAVCKYILTDLIDPTKHGAVDTELDKSYPL